MIKKLCYVSGDIYYVYYQEHSKVYIVSLFTYYPENVSNDYVTKTIHGGPCEYAVQ